MAMTEPAPLGHNLPPHSPEALRADLERDNTDLAWKRDELLAAFERAPETVEDDDTNARMADFAKQLSELAKRTDGRRKTAKEPHLQAGKVIDAYFQESIGPLKKAADAVKARMTAYMRRKAEAERRAAEEEARKQREAMEKAAAELNEADAVEAAERAQAAQKQADAKPAEHARTRGDYGTVGTLRTVWVGEVEDYDALPLDLLRPHIPREALDQAVRAFVRAGGRDLPGARIFEKSTAVVR